MYSYFYGGNNIVTKYNNMAQLICMCLYNCHYFMPQEFARIVHNIIINLLKRVYLTAKLLNVINVISWIFVKKIMWCFYVSAFFNNTFLRIIVSLV